MAAAYTRCMVKVVQTLLLIACLLACPLRCMRTLDGHEIASAQFAQEKEKTHSCCGHSANRQQIPPSCGDSDQPDGSTDYGCTDCLCQGAWFDDARVELADARVEWVSHNFQGTESSLAALVDSSCVASDSKQGRHFPWLDSGREICALTCSLLL